MFVREDFDGEMVDPGEEKGLDPRREDVWVTAALDVPAPGDLTGGGSVEEGPRLARDEAGLTTVFDALGVMERGVEEITADGTDKEGAKVDIDED